MRSVSRQHISALLVWLALSLAVALASPRVMLGQSGPDIDMWPEGTFTSPSLEVTIIVCHDNGLTTYRRIELNGVSVATAFTPWPQSPCGMLTGTVQLQSGTNAIFAEFQATNGYYSGAWIYPVYTPPSATAPQVEPKNVTAFTWASSPSTKQFYVHNPGTSSASYTLSTQCAPSASNCQAPGSVTVDAGQMETVNVTYNSGATGTTGTVKLRAEVTGTPAARDSAVVTIRIQEDPCVEYDPECPFDAAPIVSIAPGGTTYGAGDLASDSLLVTVSWCDDKGLTDHTRLITFNGANVTSQFNYTAELAQTNCPLRRQSRGKVKLVEGPNVLSATILDHSDQIGSAGASYTYAPFTYGVAVGPKNRAIRVRASLGSSENFVVTNKSTKEVPFTLSRTCSTPALNCSTVSTPVLLAAGASFTTNIDFTAASSGSNGQIRLIASYTSAHGVVADTATVSVSIGSQGSPTVTIAEDNPGTRLARQNCLTVALGGAAAAECGDLRIVHPLPTTRTLGSARTPALIYSSAHVTPTVTVGARVNMATIARPDTVEAKLSLAGVTHTRKWKGADWGSDAPQRITVAAPNLSLATGVYPYTLQVKNIYGATYTDSVLVSGQVIVINRTTSPFGSGWWLAGLEELKMLAGDSILWIGGDGSARVYAKVATDVWLAPSLDRPDTLSKMGSYYVRHMPTARTVFTLAGRHVATVNRLNHQTTFGYNSSNLLSTITIPVADSVAVPSSNASRRYTFTYSSNRLTKVTAPPAPGGVTRALVVTRSGDKVTKLTDPDVKFVTFGYVGSTARIRERIDRRGVAHRYGYDIAHKVVADTLVMSTGPNIVKRYTAVESRGAAVDAIIRSSVHADSTFAQLDGPRNDVTDITTFWVTALGNVRKVRDALGAATTVTYGSATFPALPTVVIAPNGLTSEARYNSRGLPDSTSVLNPYGATARSTTKYTWHPVWNMPTTVVPPSGVDARIESAYDVATGNRLWVQDGRGSSTRVEFSYDATGLLREVKDPLGGRDSLEYDARGNLKATKSPLGIRTTIRNDVLGRPDTVKTPIEGSLVQTRAVTYDIMNRPVTTATSAPAVPYTVRSVQKDTSVPESARSLAVTNEYDNNGNVKKVITEDPAFPGGSRSYSFDYDDAGRLTFRDDGSARGFVYDLAGNLIEYVTANNQTVTQRFDALGRLTRRASVSVTYPQETCEGHPPGAITGLGCFVVFPYFPNDSGEPEPFSAPGDPTAVASTEEGETGIMSGGMTGYRVRGDTATFHYDALGSLVRADNYAASVRRTYFPNGQLRTDTTEIRGYDQPDVNTHTRGQQYTYDLSGRPLSMSASGTFNYTYHSHGPLRKITDPLGHQYEWFYDRSGRDTASVVTPSGGGNGSFSERIYDADGRLMRRALSAWQNNQWRLIVSEDSLKYDLRGKVQHVWSRSLMYWDEWTSAAYDGIGALHVYERTRDFASVYDVEEMRHNAYGEAWWSHSRNSAAGSFSPFNAQHSIKGALHSRSTEPYQGFPPQQAFSDTLYQALAGAGVSRKGKITWDANSMEVMNQVVERHYQDGLGRVATVQRYSYRPEGTSDGTWEEYRYDALGRRVLTRVRRPTGGAPPGSNALCENAVTGICRSYFERVWWDGSQVLREEREAEGSSDAYNSGVIAYVHGLQLDQPVAVIRNGTAHVINYTWRGLAESAIAPGGAYSACKGGTQVCPLSVPFPHGAGAYYTPSPHGSGGGGSSDTWLGSLPENGAGSTGMLYRRNRYYDPESGQFTQEDPIGLAGGLNLYGFAAGDPINFADPFGTCPEDKTKEECDEEARAAVEALETHSHPVCRWLGAAARKIADRGYLRHSPRQPVTRDGSPVAGRWYAETRTAFGRQGPVIMLYPAAFSSSQMLIKTVAHEALHDRDPASREPDNDLPGKGPAYFWGDECSKGAGGSSNEG